MQKTISKIAVVHLYYFIALAILAILYDAWKLITPDALLARWQTVLVLLIAAVVVWLVANQANLTKRIHYAALVGVLVLVDIFVATASVYQQRGVASLAVALFIIPLLVVSVLRNWAILLATTVISAAAYSFAVIKYAVDFPGEGFRIEMYGEIGFWAAMFFIFAVFLKLLFMNKNS